MGLFDNIKSTVAAMADGIAQVNEANKAQEQATQDSTYLEIIDPTPQDAIDAGAQRGVLESIAYQPLEQGENVGSMAVWLTVRARLAAGQFGPSAKLKVRTSSRIAQKLRKGMEVPITLDPATGTATAIDAAGLKAERA